MYDASTSFWTSPAAPSHDAKYVALNSRAYLRSRTRFTITSPSMCGQLFTCPIARSKHFGNSVMSTDLLPTVFGARYGQMFAATMQSGLTEWAKS